MAGLAEFRQKHPEYDDLGDVELADALHEKFYADMPKHDFDKSLGIKTSQELGFVKGITTVAKNVAPLSPANLIPGFKEANARSLERQEGKNDRRAKSERPGGAGHFLGSSITSAPAMFAGGPATSGALQGYVTSDADTVGGKARDTALGAIGGKVTQGALSHLGKALAPVIDPAVARLQAAGLKLTPGMVRGGKFMAKEDKLMSRPVVGDAIAADRLATQETFNTASVNKILSPIGVKVPSGTKPGFDTITFAKDKIGKQYDTIVPNLSVTLDSNKFVTALGPTAAALPAAQRKEFQRLISLNLKNGQLSGDALKKAQGELRRLAGKYAIAQDVPSSELGNALWEADEHLTQEMLAQNPKWAPELKKVNEAYRGYRIVADAAGRADDGVINTGQLKQSVRRGDRSKNKDASARGDAFLQEFANDARKVIPAKVPNTGTTDRALAGKLIPTVKGYGALAAYRGRQALQEAQANAPDWLRKIGGALAHYSDIEGRIGSTAVANRPGER